MNLKTIGLGDKPLSIRDGCISKDLSLLVLAPHPDDFDAIGATLKFLSDKGNQISVIVSCTGSGVDDSYRPGLTLTEKSLLREHEQRESARFFGLSENCLTFIHLENDEEDQPRDNSINLEALEPMILRIRPDLIFLPHGNDSNNGHRSIYSLTRKIASRLRFPQYLVLNSDPKTISMHTDLYFPFGEAEAVWKGELLRFHDSQQQRNLNTRGYGFDERILGHNRRTAQAMSLNEPYAEAFELERLKNY